MSNFQPVAAEFNQDGTLVRIWGPNSQVAFDPSSVAITGGVIGGADVASVELRKVFQNGANIMAYRTLLAKVRSGSRVRILTLGDSTTTGAGVGTSTGANPGFLVGARIGSYSSRLAQALTAAGIPAFNESMFGDQNVTGTGETYNSYDPRVVITGGFAPNGIGSFGGGAWRSVSVGAKIAMTPSMTFDRFDVYTAQNAGLGSLVVDVDGGASLGTINEAGTINAIKTTYTVTRGTHTINLTTVNTSTTYVLGVVPWDSTLGAVDIIQGGFYGQRMTNIAATASPWSVSHPTFVGLLAPDLAIIQMQVNDSNNDVTTDSYATDLATVDSAYSAAGGAVMLMTGIPSQLQSGHQATWDATTAALFARAAAQNRVLVDLKSRSGSYTALSAAGWMADLLHGNAKFYADEGYWLARILKALAE